MMLTTGLQICSSFLEFQKHWRISLENESFISVKEVSQAGTDTLHFINWKI